MRSLSTSLFTNQGLLLFKYIYIPIIVLSLFSPLFGYLLSVFILTILSGVLRTNNRRVIGYIAIASGSIAFASRRYGFYSWDDFVNYYSTYNGVYSGFYNVIFVYGGGYEVILPFIDVFIARLLPKLTPSGLMVVYSLIFGFSLLYIMEKYYFYTISVKARGVASSLFLQYYSFYMSTQLARQWLACIFILAAINQVKKHANVSLSFTAVFTHASSVFMLLYFKLVQYKNKSVLVFIIVLASAIIYAYDESIRELYDNVSDSTGKRLRVYATLEAEDSANNSALGRLSMPILALGLSTLWMLLTSSHASFISFLSKYKTDIIGYLAMVLLYTSMLNYYSLPHRLFLIFHGLMLGYFMAIFLSYLPYVIFMISGTILTIWNVLFYGFRTDYTSDASPGYVYPLYDLIPGYFLQHFFVY